MKVTAYFNFFRNRPDRAIIKDEWIERTINFPDAEMVQQDGRIRRGAKIDEMGGRYLRVILLDDGVTVPLKLYIGLFLIAGTSHESEIFQGHRYALY